MKKSIRCLNLTKMRCVFLLPVIFICKSVDAQQNNVNDSLQLKPRVYKVSVFTNKIKRSADAHGFLVNLSDSGLQLSSSPIYFSPNDKDNFSSVYNYDQLKKVVIQRKGSVGRGILIGALTGMGIGAIGGLASGDDPPGFLSFTAGQKAVGLGIIGILPGALIGGLVGAGIYETYIIDGNKNKYDTMRQSIFNKLSRHSSKTQKIISYKPF